MKIGSAGPICEIGFNLRRGRFPQGRLQLGPRANAVVASSEPVELGWQGERRGGRQVPQLRGKLDRLFDLE